MEGAWAAARRRRRKNDDAQPAVRRVAPRTQKLDSARSRVSEI
jgi:hypothetical protein